MALDSDEEDSPGLDGIMAGGIILVLVVVLVGGLFLARRQGPGKPPREEIQSRVAHGVISSDLAAEAERLLELDAPGAPDSVDGALQDLYTRRSSGAITDAEFWRARDALGR